MNLPIHPMIVHLPLVLAATLPVVLGFVLRLSSRSAVPERVWRVAAVVAVVLALSASAAVYSGEQDEEIVEDLVSESALEIHEDRADLFLWLSWVLAGVTAAGLLPGLPGRSARLVAVGGSVLLLAAAVGVGHAGAELVYRHGAAQAYTAGQPTPHGTSSHR